MHAFRYCGRVEEQAWEKLGIKAVLLQRTYFMALLKCGTLQMIPGHLLFEIEPPRMGTLITCLFICSYLEEERERDFYQLLSSAVPKDVVRTDLKRKHIDQLKQHPNSPCCAPLSDVN